ncbi:protein translocase subunit SecF [Candidatus Gottesmanbacteria bacterium]|nr:protein translocase subunit SecF [Candidatus Gottesmanbacteria bacterium]
MIRFSKYLWLYVLISALVLVPGMYSLVRFGFRKSVDFTGGTLLELLFTKPVEEKILTDVAQKQNILVASIQRSGDTTYILRIKPESNENISRLKDMVERESSSTATVLRQETVGPVLGQELLAKAIVAAILAIVCILGYVAYAFKNIKFGVSAIIALIHDLFVVVGVFSLLGVWKGVEVDTLFVTAFLTTMSFSVHDTIVVFDRIREYRRRDEKTPFDQIADRALTETMGRSLTNSFTIIFMLLALILMGGETVRWFVVALLVGTISGTYSSPFVATPILILWDRWERRKKKIS